MDLRELEPVLLAAVRVTVFLVLAPPFAHGAVPGAVKAMLGIGLAAALHPPLLAPSRSAAGFLGHLAGEAVVGGGLAVAVAVVFAAVQSAGRLIDLHGGFEMATAFDPLSLTSGGQFTRFYALTATVLLFVSDGYQLVIGGLARTFDAVPLGASLDMPVLADALVVGLAQMMLAALEVAGPLIAVLFLADVGLGLLTRVAPALNAFALGFPLKILITLTAGVFALTALPQVVSTLAGDALDVLARVTG